MDPEPRAFDLQHLKKLLQQCEEQVQKHETQQIERPYQIFYDHISELIRIQAYVRRWICQVQYLKIKKMRIKRERVAQEIIQTEKIYVDNIEKLHTFFLEPLRGNIHTANCKEFKGVCRDITVILGFNRVFLNDLNHRMMSWHENQKIGDIFLKMSAFLKAYTQYTAHYTEVLLTLDRLSTGNAEFAAFYEGLRLAPEIAKTNMYLRDFLIMPVQRIPRYVLLLKELLSSTWKTHPDYDALREALSSISKTAEFIDSSQEEYARITRILSVKNSLFGRRVQSLSLVAPHRKLVQEGEVTEVTGSGRKPAYIFLFNDLIIWTKPHQNKTKFEVTAFEKLTSIMNVKQSFLADEIAICIYVKTTVQFFLVPTIEECNLWISNLNHYVNESSQKQIWLDENTQKSQETDNGANKIDLNASKKIKRYSTIGFGTFSQKKRPEFLAESSIASSFSGSVSPPSSSRASPGLHSASSSSAASSMSAPSAGNLTASEQGSSSESVTQKGGFAGLVAEGKKNKTGLTWSPIRARKSRPSMFSAIYAKDKASSPSTSSSSSLSASGASTSSSSSSSSTSTASSSTPLRASFAVKKDNHPPSLTASATTNPNPGFSSTSSSTGSSPQSTASTTSNNSLEKPSPSTKMERRKSWTGAMQIRRDSTFNKKRTLSPRRQKNGSGESSPVEQTASPSPSSLSSSVMNQQDHLPKIQEEGTSPRSPNLSATDRSTRKTLDSEASSILTTTSAEAPSRRARGGSVSDRRTKTPSG